MFLLKNKTEMQLILRICSSEVHTNQRTLRILTPVCLSSMYLFPPAMWSRGNP